MKERLAAIVDVLEADPEVRIINPLTMGDMDSITGSISVTVDTVVLDFSVRIMAPYPMQFHGSETVAFINSSLLSYNHVNADGSVCFHSHHSRDLGHKLRMDITSLKQWIRKYYIDKGKDEHYEHLIIPLIDSTVYLFTEVPYEFKTGDFGVFEYSELATGSSQKKPITTRLVQAFTVNKMKHECAWSKAYLERPRKEGLFTFIKDPPSVNGRFAIEKWEDLEPHVTKDFLKLMHSMNRYPDAVPLLLGYRIPGNEIHWVAITVPAGKFPNYIAKIPRTSLAIERLTASPISWSQTRNCSYPYFFGRGAFPQELTNSRILIIGTGAVGSMVSTTLTRGGCRKIGLTDFDLKEPENVCRAEFLFSRGVNAKVNELKYVLTTISPFVEVSTSEDFMDMAKFKVGDESWREVLIQVLEECDFIFDCSTDNDVASILDQLSKPERIFTISITNNAQELICAVPPNLYKWMNVMAETLQTGEVDYYNPNGCWNPTFKASYNDIAVLVQFSLKHIGQRVREKQPVRSFYVSTSEENGLNIKLNEF